MEHFNKLTPAEAERLAYLIEELSEVQHIACKILRHGYSSYDPTAKVEKYRVLNRELLETEIRDVMKAVMLLIKNKDIQECNIVVSGKPTYKYMHHQAEDDVI